MSANPVQLGTVPMDMLRTEQWELALLLLKASTQVLTVQEVYDEVHKLKAVIDAAEISWKA